MKFLKVCVHGSLAFLVFVATGCNREKLDLAINLKPGDERTAVVTENGKEVMKIGTNSIRGSSVAEIHYGFRATAVGSDGDITMEATVRSCSFNETADFGAGAGVPFQNARGRSPLQELMERLVDKKFTFVLSSKGEVKSLSGADEIRKRLEAEADLKALKGMEKFTDSQRKQFIDGFFDSFSERAFRAQMDRIFHLLPLTPVSRGNSWTNARIDSVERESTEQRTLTVKSVDASRITLESKTEVKPATAKDKVAKTGAGTGTIVLDKATGLCVRQELSTKVTTTNSEESQFHGESESSTVVEMF